MIRRQMKNENKSLIYDTKGGGQEGSLRDSTGYSLMT